MKNSGLVHLYCGDGQGQDDSRRGSCGAAQRARRQGRVRAVSQGRHLGRVPRAREARRDPLLAANPVGKFSFRMTEEEKAETAAALGRTFDAATGFAVRERATLLVLDEICAAVNCGFLPEKTLTEFLESRPDSLEVVLTGRDPSENLQVHADYITEMKKRRHPFDEGVAAREGIEF